MKKSVLFFGVFLSALTSEGVAETLSTPTKTLNDFMFAEEKRVCVELHSFAEQNLLKDDAVLKATENRNTRAVAKASSKYASILKKEYDTDFLFYHPNTRFFVRVNDKGYRGRVRLPIEELDTDFEKEMVCYWERLPSQDVVLSALVKNPEEKTGYFKVSKKLSRMLSNIPDVLASFGKPRVYSALDKTGLKKMAWFKMRKKEPNKTTSASWCTAENLAFLSSVGQGKDLPKKEQKELLASSDEGEDFTLSNKNISGGSFAVEDVYDERIATVVYTLDSSTGNASVKVDTKKISQEEECTNKVENFFYRFFD